MYQFVFWLFARQKEKGGLYADFPCVEKTCVFVFC